MTNAMLELDTDHKKMVEEFGAKYLDKEKSPDYYTFQNELLYAHIDFDKFLSAVKSRKKCAIVSGFNPSGTIHIGHKSVFDTNLYFQEKHNCDVYIPLSDDESYVARKVESQEEALKNAYRLAKEILAYGYNPKKTHFIIDQIYTNIYNLAFKYSRQITLSTTKAVYGYKDETNIGLTFYPSVQAAHVTLPQYKGYAYTLVPIGIDEYNHLRIARDVAAKFNITKPAVVLSRFMPGLDGAKMSSSKPQTAIFLKDSINDIQKKIDRAMSGGRDTLAEHKKYGGNPEKDMSYIYLKSYFLAAKQAKKIANNYKSGKMLSSEMKELLFKHVKKYLQNFQKRYSKITDKKVEKCFLRNEIK